MKQPVNIPNGWAWGTVEELGAEGEQTVLTGPFGTNLKSSHFASKGVPVLTIGCLTDQGIDLSKAVFLPSNRVESLERYKLKSGDMLFSRMASVGRACIVPDAIEGSLFNYHIMRLRISSALYEPNLFIYYIRGAEVVKQYLKDVNHGATRDGVNTKQLLKMPVLIPPRAEQRRIVVKLDEFLGKVYACRERLNHIPNLLRQFRQSVLNLACSGRLTKDWLGRDEPGELPAGWRWVQLEDLLIPGGIFDGPFGSNLKTEDYTGEGVRVIRLENIGHLSFISDKKTYISQEKYETLIKHKVKEGDIIFASFIDDEIRACVLPELETDAIAKADCFCLRPDEKQVERTYLTYQLICRETYNALTSNIHGATRPRINTTQLRKLKVRVCPLEEQAEIVRRVEALFKIADTVEENYRKAQAQFDKLPQSILAKAFRGELVPQDPDDEPASVLLERIRAEKAEAGKPEKKNNKRPTAAKSRTAAGRSTLF